MSEATKNPALADFLTLVHARRGHFELESGHHSNLWLDLDGLFFDSKRVTPFVRRLVEQLRPHNITLVCGPQLGGAFLAQWVARELGASFCFTERIAADTPNTKALYSVRYVLPNAFQARVNGQRTALVDDVMSAGSALRGTYQEMQRQGANVIVIGALLTLGQRGESFFQQQALPTVTAIRDDFSTWLPAECPLCAQKIALEQVTQ